MNDFFFPWEEERSVENPNTVKEDEEFSEPKILVSEPPRQPLAMELDQLRAPLRTYKTFDL